LHSIAGPEAENHVRLQMYAAARSSASNHEELQRHITEAMATKAEWESKVQVLQHELQSLANATPELLEQLQYEVEELRGIVADMETEKQSFFDQTAGLRAAKAQLKDRTKEVQQLLHSARVCSLVLLSVFCGVLLGFPDTSIRAQAAGRLYSQFEWKKCRGCTFLHHYVSPSLLCTLQSSYFKSWLVSRVGMLRQVMTNIGPFHVVGT
jgi:uncharacterized protein YoxC